jgi:hypothetical protein
MPFNCHRLSAANSDLNGWEGVPNAPNWLFFAIQKKFLVRFGAIWCE